MTAHAKLWLKSALLCLAVLAAASLLAQKVKVERDPAVDLSRFKTYAWTDGTPAPNPAWHQVIEATITSELEAKGLRRAAPKDADLLVAYHVAGGTGINVADNFPPVTSGPWYAGTMGGTARYVKQGTLAVHLFDREKQQLAWAATAKDPVKETPKKRVEQLNKAVQKMFPGF